MANDFVKQGYNKAADNYVVGRNQSENDVFLDKLNNLLKPNSLILDIGCGGGKPVDSYLIGKGHRVIGIDISEKMIDLAKQNIPEAEYKVEDMSDFQIGEYHVEAVVSFYAIFHTARETHEDIFKKINSFLDREGFILITMGVDDWEGTEEDFHGAQMYWSHFDANKNRELIKKAGFNILSEEIIQTDAKQQIILAQKI